MFREFHCFLKIEGQEHCPEVVVSLDRNKAKAEYWRRTGRYEDGAEWKHLRCRVGRWLDDINAPERDPRS